jgi:hypothetical protein
LAVIRPGGSSMPPLGILTLPNSEPLLHSGEQWPAIWLTGAACGGVGSRRDEGRREEGTPSHRQRAAGGGRGKRLQVATVYWWGLFFGCELEWVKMGLGAYLISYAQHKPRICCEAALQST